MVDWLEGLVGFEDVVTFNFVEDGRLCAETGSVDL